MPVDLNGRATCDVCNKMHNRRTYEEDGKEVSLCLVHDPKGWIVCAECTEKFRPQTKYYNGTRLCSGCRFKARKAARRISGTISEFS